MSTVQRSGTCDYCGFPIQRPWWSRTKSPPTPEGPQYCCFGCKFAAEVTQARGEQANATWTLTRLGLAIFFTMNVMVFSMALWTQDVSNTGADQTDRLAASFYELFRYLCLILSLPVLFLLGGPLIENAWRGLRGGAVVADSLLALGVIASYSYSAAAVLRGTGYVYFEVGCMVLVMVTLGRWLEALGKLKTGEAIESLHRLLPDQVRVLRPSGEIAIALADVAVGDLIRVLPGERVCTDGRVRQGSASVDEQILTGESSPKTKEPGDAILAGTCNLDGELVIEVTTAARDGTLARLVAMVQRARQSKGRYERLADRVSSWFIPAACLLAIATFVAHASRDSIDHGIMSGLAVLLIACPCALGLATPMAVWAALGQAARAGVLFRDGTALERLALVRAVRLDKTGTLSTDTPTVAQFITAEGTDLAAALRLAGRLASASTHSLSGAIQTFAANLGVDLALPTHIDSQTLSGRGLIGTLSSPIDQTTTVYLGSKRFMDERAQDCDGHMKSAVEGAIRSAQPIVCLGWGGAVRGVFAFREQLRPEAWQAIDQLSSRHLDIRVLTGDHAARAETLARELGISVEAELLPEDKVAAIEHARMRFGPIAMVGDGINDAPAMAASDVGIALGCGADVSRDSAAICLIGNDLTRIAWAIDLARQTSRVIRQNLFWAFAYNTIGIGFACSGRLNPIVSALAMVASSLVVVSNSLRLSGRIEPAKQASSGSFPVAVGDAREVVAPAGAV